MPTRSSCRTAAAPSRRRWRWSLAASVAAWLGACTPPPAPPHASTAAQTVHPPAEVQPFDQAVDNVATTLVTNARLNPSERRLLVIDPPVQRLTGDESHLTRAVEQRIAGVISQRFPSVQEGSWTSASLERQPLVLLACMTPVARPGAYDPVIDGPTEVYRINASLSDTRSGKTISQESAWIRTADVDLTPAPFFRDSPAWSPDRGLRAYLKVCSGKPGETMDTAFVTGLDASIAAEDGMRAYEDGHYQEALANYHRASLLPGGDQMRVLNGLYLTNVALGRQRAAAEAFGRIVDVGLDQGVLAVKFVFRPASVQFWPDPAVSGEYPMWLQQIARRTADHDTCLRVIGHTSPTGAPEVNQILSERRAQFVRRKLVRDAPVLEARTEALGRGASDPLVGTGRDDATDLLDRRVDFEPSACGMVRADRIASRAR